MKPNQEKESFLKTDGGKSKFNAIEVPSITLPKGGGAIKGIDEKFSVNAVNGTSSFSVPLPFSPARGASPSLGISYSSGAGNGIFGLGWNLSLGSIKRKTDKGLPQYFDYIDSDTFLFSEAEDLVPEFKKTEDGSFILDAGGDYVINEKDSSDTLFAIRFYKPRIEGLFARIERWSNKTTNEIKWRVISRENTTTLFGWTAQSRIADPNDVNKIYEWLPEFVFDDKGNCSQYIYKKEDNIGFDDSFLHNRNRHMGSSINYTNIYLQKVLYGNLTPYKQFGDAFPNESDYMFQTIFDYGTTDANSEPFDQINAWDYRPDAFSDYKAGFEIRTTRLCKRVLLFHVFEELALKPDKSDKKTLIRSVNFDYDTSTEQDFTFLKKIYSHGYIKKADGTYSEKHLPPMEFTYQSHDWNKEVKTIATEDLVHAPSGLDEQQYQFTDLYNEGLNGILTEQATGWYYKHNLGNGKFEQAKLVSPKPSFAGLGSVLQLADLDADGGKQIVSFSNEPLGFFELDDDNEWQGFRSFKALPNIDFGDSNTRMLDLNGDGKPEVVISEENVFTWYPSEGRNGFKQAQKTTKHFDEEAGPALVFADQKQTIFLADMSGSGLSDIVRIRNGEVCYWPNLGYGKFGAKVAMDNAPVFDYPDSFNPAYLRLTDIDGSGTTDIIYLGKNKFTCWKNLSGNRFGTSPFEIDPFPEIHSASKITVTDLLGNGVACIVWSSPLSKDANAPLKYIDLMNSKKPHIMVSYKNNMGKEVSLEYTPSTHFYLEDKQLGKPWVTKLHFPVHLLTKTTAYDKWRKTTFTSQYSYHHGYYDHAEREFRGFGRVEQVDAEEYGRFAAGNVHSPYITDDLNLYQPPILTKTWFHTGAFLDKEKILSQFSKEYFTPTSASFSENKLPEPDLNALDLSIAEYKEALRSCKGMMLRQEIFELDVDELAIGNYKPVKLFSAAYHNCHIQRLQPQKDNDHAVFLTTESEAITYNYELELKETEIAPDPRIAHTLNLQTDEFGNVLEAIAVVYPRIGLHADDSLPEGATELIASMQKQQHISYSVNAFTNDVITDTDFRLRLPCGAKTFEVSGLAPASGSYFSLEELRTATSGVIDEIEYHILPTDTSLQKRMVQSVRILYFKPDLETPEDFGVLNHFALPYETYTLALTKELLAATIGEKLNQLKLSGEADDAMLDRILSKGGYHNFDGKWWIRSGIAGFADDAADHFYLPEKYTDPFGNVTTLQFDEYDLYIKSSDDAVGNHTEVLQFDFRVLAPSQMKDINNNISEVLYDTIGMPAAMALKGKGDEGDNLDNVTAQIKEAALIDFFTDDVYDEVQAQTFLGNATARYVYYFGKETAGETITYGNHPACAAGITREKHVAQLDDGEISPVQIAFEYSDGSGTVIAVKAQAEPETEGGAIRWITNGKTILNNKGKPVKQYEPYFTDVHTYAEPEQVGVTPLMYYDAAGRLIRTEAPDGSYSRVEFTPWFGKVFDQNDTVLEEGNGWYSYNTNSIDPTIPMATDAQKNAAALAAVHANTAAQIFTDSLGRTVISIAHNKWNRGNAIEGETTFEERQLTYTKLDAEGKPLWIQDARGNRVMQYIFPYKPDDISESAWDESYSPCYDIAGNLLFQHSMDAGDRWMITDAAGKPFYSWDVNERQLIDNSFLMELRMYHAEYDGLHRPIELWLTINDAAPALIDKTIYGEFVTNALALNLRGQAYQHSDSGGMIINNHFDFKGNLLEATKQIAAAYKVPVINWQDGLPTNALKLEVFSQQTEYDALNRMTRHYNWHKSNTNIAVYEPLYSKRGLLEAEDIIVKANKTEEGYEGGQRTTAISRIIYDAKGQLQRIYYGNGTATRYSYDEKTFRLLQLRTTRRDFEPPFPNQQGVKDARVLQNLYYTYDAVGNITEIYDDAYEPAFFNNQMVEPRSAYTYDALYQLIQATGRENSTLNNAPTRAESESANISFPIVAHVLRNYTQQYFYDAAGNILQMKHRAGNGNLTDRWTRSYVYDDNSNRLLQTWNGTDEINAINYHYDTHGCIRNLENVSAEQYMRWNYNDMLQSLNLTGGGWAYYQYDGSKERNRKVIERLNGIKEERQYLGGMEWYRRYNGAGNMLEEIETHHLFAGSQRVLIVEDVISTDNTALSTDVLYRYQYNNHLGSSSLELNENAVTISYEEYHPYGTTSFSATNSDIKAAAKRYRYTGMERDDETGMAYHSARYYLPWLGRWLSSDPIGIEGGMNLFCYLKGRIILHSDRSGLGWFSDNWDALVEKCEDATTWVSEKSSGAADWVYEISNEVADVYDEAGFHTLATATRGGAVVSAALTKTVLEVGGQALAIGPNIVVGLDSGGTSLSSGVNRIANAEDSSDVALGGLEILKGLGDFASAALSVLSPKGKGPKTKTKTPKPKPTTPPKPTPPPKPETGTKIDTEPTVRGTMGGTSPPPSTRPPSLLQRAKSAGAADEIDGPFEVFAHGTTSKVAKEMIESQGANLSSSGGNFSGKLHTVPDAEVAKVFAGRSASKVTGETPAIVGIALPESTVVQLKANGLLKLQTIDNPPPGVSLGAQEWIFQPGALEALKKDGFFWIL